MSKRPPKRPRAQPATAKASPLMVRLDAECKKTLAAAAELRRISVSGLENGSAAS